jgi:hypothetical protein
MKQKKGSLEWWCMPVIPASREVEVGESLSKAGWAKVGDPIWKVN